MKKLKYTHVLLLSLLAACLMFSLIGCSQSKKESKASDSQASAAAQADTKEDRELVIGTLATEDFLPLWFAEDQKLFDADKVGAYKLMVFQSAQELSAALSAKSVDMAMTDVVVAANIDKASVPMQIEWTTLGETPQEGRFGILAGPNSNISQLSELKGVPVGVGSGTMLEYVMDKLMLNAGLSKDEIKKEELKKLPARLQAVMSGQCEAGVFPATLLELGLAQGGKLIADDTKGENLSQSVMALNAELSADPKMAARIEAVKDAWNKAADAINADNAKAKEVLLKYVKLPEVLQENYPIQHYPQVSRPKAETVQPVLDWMLEKNYLDSKMNYDEKSGRFVRG